MVAAKVRLIGDVAVVTYIRAAWGNRGSPVSSRQAPATWLPRTAVRVSLSIAGESFADFLAREIVAPAGLSHTTPDVPLPSEIDHESNFMVKRKNTARVAMLPDSNAEML
jgi:hypothetical protein